MSRETLTKMANGSVKVLYVKYSMITAIGCKPSDNDAHRGKTIDQE